MDVAHDKESQVKSSCDQGCDCGTDQHVETVEEVLDSELVQVEINGIFQVRFLSFIIKKHYRYSHINAVMVSDYGQ